MTDKNISITVLVICYKQQEVIKRALDSILCQKEYGLNKIVVCDDCSPDNTWKVLQDYKSRYPDYFEIHRNDPNLGIYQNMLKLLSLRGDSDLYVNLSGDDAFDTGYFKALQEFIIENNIDFSKPVGIFSDFANSAPDGEFSVRSQKLVECCKDNLLSLYLRQKICCRSLVLNNKVLEKHKGTIFNKGLALAEWLFDINRICMIESVYYVPVIGDIYFSGIGVSTKLLNSQYYISESIEKWEYLKDKIILKQEDKKLADAEIYKARFLAHPKISLLVRSIFLYMQSGYPQKVSFKELNGFTFLMRKKIFGKYESRVWYKCLKSIKRRLI